MWRGSAPPARRQATALRQSVRRSESITYRTRSSVNALLIQRPPAHPCESVGSVANRQSAGHARIRARTTESRSALPPPSGLTRFDAPCARRPHHIRLSCRGPAQQMRSVIADYRAAAIVDKRAQIDIVVHKCFHFHCTDDTVHPIAIPPRRKRWQNNRKTAARDAARRRPAPAHSSTASLPGSSLMWANLAAKASLLRFSSSSLALLLASPGSQSTSS